MSQPMPADLLRPRDLALLLLASGDLQPRQRARDQQADAAGLELKRRLLDRLTALDPEPSDLEEVLARLIDEFGQPTGPTRSLAITIRDEWRAACTNPEWVAQLLAEAVQKPEKIARAHRRGL
ncbi:MAG TPA: hypothetical protein VGY77_02990 [Gemmataceae bacterium]|nr:hypothetical protein [Gemmataceae bacterium]